MKLKLKKMFFVLITATTLLVTSCKPNDKAIKMFGNIATKLIENAENPETLRVSRAVFTLNAKNVPAEFFIKFSFEDYYNVPRYHSLYAIFKDEKTFEYEHTGVNTSEQRRGEIESMVNSVFNSIEADKKGTYNGKRNLPNEDIDNAIEVALNTYNRGI